MLIDSIYRLNQDLRCSLLAAVWKYSFDPGFILTPDDGVLAMNRAAKGMLSEMKNKGIPEPLDLLCRVIDVSGPNIAEPVQNVQLDKENLSLSVRLVSLGQDHYLALVRVRDRDEKSEPSLLHMQETIQELTEIIELSADGLVSVDNEGVLLRMNRAYEEIVGVRAKDFVGRPARDLMRQGYLPDLVSNHVLQDMKPKHLYVRLKDKEVLLTGRPVFNRNGDFIRIVANIRDLSELNKLKEELKKYHALTNGYATELKRLRAESLSGGLVGSSLQMKKVLDLALQAGQVESTVLVWGETGTGKEIVARIIHENSRRKDGPFITLNCASLPESLLESELFGYEKGAFTGAASQGRAGLFEAAQGGTLFLDEIAEMSIGMQSKLLRFLQEKKVRRLSSASERELDVRIVAATNKDLKVNVEQSLFREDLFYRLNVINIHIAPLRERKEDIPLLLEHFQQKYNTKYGLNKHIPRHVLTYLLNYHWPGNVRELENIVERLAVLDTDLYSIQEILWSGTKEDSHEEDFRTLKDIMEEVEKETVLRVYNKYRSTRKAAARLGISQAGMVRKLQKYQS